MVRTCIRGGGKFEHGSETTEVNERDENGRHGAAGARRNVFNKVIQIGKKVFKLVVGYMIRRLRLHAVLRGLGWRGLDERRHIGHHVA